MNWDQVKAKWKEMSGNIPAELDGNREAPEGKPQAKYGKTKEQVQKEVDDVLNDH